MELSVDLPPSLPKVRERKRKYLARIWRASLVPGRSEDYDRFAMHVFRPMFASQTGLLGIEMMRNEIECCVITYWPDLHAIKLFESSSSYKAAVNAITQSGFLIEVQSAVVMSVSLSHRNDNLLG